MRFARPAARRRACGCSGLRTTIPSPPPLCCRKKTKKRKSSLWRVGRSMLRPYKIIPLYSSPYANRSLVINDVRILGLMKVTRQLIAFLIVLAGPLLLLSSTQTSEKAAKKGQYLAFVGTYTTKTSSKGIYGFRFDTATGQLSAIGVAAETPDPSWVVVHSNGKFLYAVNEAGKSSMVSAFALEPKTGNLALLNQLPALGEDPCYISFDRTGKYVFVANYTSGNVVVFPIGSDGKLGAATANVRDEGILGPNKE